LVNQFALPRRRANVSPGMVYGVGGGSGGGANENAGGVPRGIGEASGGGPETDGNDAAGALGEKALGSTIGIDEAWFTGPWDPLGAVGALSHPTVMASTVAIDRKRPADPAELGCRPTAMGPCSTRAHRRIPCRS
jgi:hypothetical protein